MGAKLVWDHENSLRFCCYEPTGSFGELLWRFWYHEGASFVAFLWFRRDFSCLAMTATPSLGVEGHQIEPKASETCSFLPISTSKSEGIAIAGISVGEN